VALKRFLQSLLLCGLLAGCTTSFTYNQLDWLIPWYVDGYVNLTRDQKKNLTAELEPFLAWHRNEELERYIEILDEVEAGIASPLTAAQVLSWIEDIVAAAERTELTMLYVGLQFGETLSDAQMQEFTDSLWERQREHEEEFLDRTDEEYTRDNYDNLKKFIVKFIGRVSRKQKDQLRAAAADLCRFDRPWLTDSEEWLQELEPLLQRKAGWQAEVETAFLARKANRSPTFNECVDKNYRVVSQALADILNQASESQCKRLVREIEDYRSQFQRIIQSGEEQRPLTSLAAPIKHGR
jgi:hypothetical protein